MTVNADQIPSLSKIAGVKSIHENLIYYPIVRSRMNLTRRQLNATYAFDDAPLKQMGVEKLEGLREKD